MDGEAPETVPRGSVVVGVDGSAQADEALRWAAEQALLEDRHLVVLHAADTGTALAAAWAGSPGASHEALCREVEASGRELVEGAARAARDLVPGVRARTAVGPLDPRQALLAASTHAGLVVVGSRGRGPLRSVVLGSVSAAVARHARCPVVVLRPRRGGDPCSPLTGVVVGSGSDVAGPAALERAFRHAAARSLPLTVLRDPAASPLSPLGDAAARWPQVEVRHRPGAGRDAAHDLAAAAATAHLVVLSGPHRRPGHGLGRTATALAVLEHACGPVCVVPEPAPAG